MDYSSSITPPSFSFKYDVFLSFSGEDTRYSFTNLLYEALRDKQIEVYVDQLQKGEEISSDLLKIIEESKISVIIFSKNYTASIWRLEELVHILKSKHMHNQIVIPVYYDIEPADVRRLTNTFEAAFKKHEESYDYGRVQRWREALTDAANISGFDLRDFKSESELKQAIVKEILNKLNVMPLSSPENTHTIDIREEDSGHGRDEEVPNVSLMTLKEKVRREKINEKMKVLIDMVPGCNKVTRKAVVLDEIINYVQALQRQVEALSTKLSTVSTIMDFNVEAFMPNEITVERMFVASNLILEIPSAVFDQLSSVHKPQYVLLSMLMSLTTMLICIIELVYKGGEARVGWRWRKKIPWFYYPSPSDKPFGTVTDFIGLLCAFIQCIFSVSYYVFYLRNINYPIKISIWPLVFAFCLLCSTFSKKSPKRNPPKKMFALTEP